jgi:hypothetical protein
LRKEYINFAHNKGGFMKTKILATPAAALAFGLAFAIVTLVIASCDNDLKDDVGTVTINLGASAASASAPNARAVAAWPPDEAEILADLTHFITLSCDGQANIERTVEGGGMVTIPDVRTGTWTVSIDAWYLMGAFHSMYATGSKYVEVIAGKENPVTVTMEPVHLPYFVGSKPEWEAAVADIIVRAPNHKNFSIIVTESFSIDATISSSFTFGDAYGIDIAISGESTTPTISLDSNGSLLRIAPLQRVLTANLTYEGLSTNDAPLIFINGASAFEMYGNSTVTSNNNTSGNGGGVVVNNGTFTMRGGMVSGNTASGNGGGVFVEGNGRFIMDYDEIYYTCEISGNTAGNYGGGVYVGPTGMFAMKGGVISGNTANEGGGMCIDGTSTSTNGAFRVETGTIYGSDITDTTLRNTATSSNSDRASLFRVYPEALAEHGTFTTPSDPSTWVKVGDLLSTGVYGTDDTITVVSGVLES